MGLQPIAGRGITPRDDRPTVGPMPAVPPQTGTLRASDVIQVLQQITGGPVDQEAVDRLIRGLPRVRRRLHGRRDCGICVEQSIPLPIRQDRRIPSGFSLRKSLSTFKARPSKPIATGSVTNWRRLPGWPPARKNGAAKPFANWRRNGRAPATSKTSRGTAPGRAGNRSHRPFAGFRGRCASKEWAKRLLNLGHRYRPEYD